MIVTECGMLKTGGARWTVQDDVVMARVRTWYGDAYIAASGSDSSRPLDRAAHLFVG